MIELKDSLRGLEPYDPDFTQVEVPLSANENNYELPRSIQEQILQAIPVDTLNRYPDPMANDLRDSLANWHGAGLTRKNVCVSNGGDELIFNLLLAFGGPNRPLVNCTPTFSIYELYARITDTPVIEVKRKADYQVDTLAVAQTASQAGIIMLTSPNNPTGNLVDPAWVEELASSTQALIVVDEAYVEFAGEQASCKDLVARFDNVCVLRTFSKAFGMAGVRCGYLLAPEAVVNGLSAVRQPYSVDVCAQAIAGVALRNADYFMGCVDEICASREWLKTQLGALEGVAVWPSAANFLLVKIAGARQVRQLLRDEYSILVRDFSSTPGLEDCLRITIGMPAENQRVVDAFRCILSGRKDQS